MTAEARASSHYAALKRPFRVPGRRDDLRLLVNPKTKRKQPFVEGSLNGKGYTAIWPVPNAASAVYDFIAKTLSCFDSGRRISDRRVTTGMLAFSRPAYFRHIFLTVAGNCVTWFGRMPLGAEPGPVRTSHDAPTPCRASAPAICAFCSGLRGDEGLRCPCGSLGF